ncbi:hypothetical protein P3602_06590 [Vibrio parahaemolyticus]|nr:hypothetical protein [Vibrio parahaemolyticus]MDF4770866.1 hypothetical protein [Vibrio parahaemolyticus]MDF5053677.1 hypothetical protein [Vibrio parahaemolyticus]MDF5105221.1 hypothetical protein [Vibrio parahaemolyticus]MDF5114169.1 hypothetical protein [Vibrio parahaemolyticus]
MHNKIGSFTGIAGFIISLVSLYISYQTSLDRAENLRVSLNAQRFGYETQIKAPVADIIPALLKTNWDIVVTNTSDRTTTILQSELFLLGDSGRKEYSGLLQGLYLEDGKKATLPITLESGEHIKLKAVIGYEVSPTAYKLLQKAKFKPSTPFEIDEMHTYLCSHNMDFRGNKASCTEGLISISDTSIDNLFILKLSTARDNSFETAGFWYKLRTTY